MNSGMNPSRPGKDPSNKIKLFDDYVRKVSLFSRSLRGMVRLLIFSELAVT